jgi:DNA-binding CsgD family transcriptional regulator
MFVPSMSALDELIGDIYEAAVLPEFWPHVLDRVAAAAGMKGGLLFTADSAQIVRWVGSEVLHDVVHELIRDGWMARNSRAAKLAPMQYSGFVSDLDLFTPDEMDNDPFYRDLLRPHGIGWGAGTIVPVPSGDILAITVEGDSGPVAKEAVEFLDRLRPHLARAGLLSARLRLERARSQVEVLERMGLPAAVLQSDGRLLAANTLLTDFRGQFFAARDRIRIAHAPANALLLDAIGQLDASASRGDPWSIPVPASRDGPALVVHLLPVVGAAHDIFWGALGVLIVTTISSRAPAPELLNGLFDLTPGEARMAALVGSGLSPRESANKLGIAEETARTVLKRVFSKTGVSRQSELVALLTKLVLR